MASDEQICVIFRSVSSREHCFSPQVLKTIHTQTPLGGLKMLFLSIRETNGWRVPRLGWGDFHFLALKMQFLPSPETNVSRVPSFVWAHFLLFGDLNMRFLPNRDIHGSSSFSALWRPEKAISSRVVKQTVQGYMFSCKFIFCILGAWKCDFCRVV